MGQKPNHPLKIKKEKEISHKNKTLNLFNIIFLILMTNTSLVGILKALVNLSSHKNESLKILQYGTDGLTIVVVAIFIFLNSAINKITISKKHDEYVLKIQHPSEKVNLKSQKKNHILTTSHLANRASTLLTLLSHICAVIFIFLGLYGLLEKYEGHLKISGLIDIIAYGIYFIAVILIIINKFMIDRIEKNIEKDLPTD